MLNIVTDNGTPALYERLRDKVSKKSIVYQRKFDVPRQSNSLVSDEDCSVSQVCLLKGFSILESLNMSSNTIEHVFFHNFILTQLTTALFNLFAAQLFGKTIVSTKQTTGQQECGKSITPDHALYCLAIVISYFDRFN